MPGISVRFGMDNRGMMPIYAVIPKKRETLEAEKDVLSLVFGNNRKYWNYRQIAVWVRGYCMASFGVVLGD